MPHIVQAALLVRYLTFLYLLEFLSTSLTLPFKAHLCFTEVVLTPHAECEFALNSFNLKVLLGVIRTLAPVVLNTLCLLL